MPLLYYKYYTAKTTVCTPYIEIRKEAVPLRFSVTERPLFLCVDNHIAVSCLIFFFFPMQPPPM